MLNKYQSRFVQQMNQNNSNANISKGNASSPLRLSKISQRSPSTTSKHGKHLKNNTIGQTSASQIYQDGTGVGMSMSTQNFLNQISSQHSLASVSNKKSGGVTHS